MDTNNNYESACNAIAQERWGETARVQVGFDGLYPAPGLCFAEIIAAGGPRAKVSGDSTADALAKLYRFLTGRPPRQVPGE